MKKAYTKLNCNEELYVSSSFGLFLGIFISPHYTSCQTRKKSKQEQEQCHSKKLIKSVKAAYLVSDFGSFTLTVFARLVKVETVLCEVPIPPPLPPPPVKLEEGEEPAIAAATTETVLA